MQQITDTQRAALRIKLATMPPEMRHELVGLMRVERAPAELIAVAESAVVELREMERKHKAEMSAAAPASAPKSVTENQFQIPVIPVGIALFIGLSVVVFVGVYYVLIPAAIALAHGVVIVAPYVAGGALVIFALLALFGGVSASLSRRTGATSSPAPGQNTYTQNIYINQHVETNSQAQGK